jgi:hypothetical protein
VKTALLLMTLVWAVPISAADVAVEKPATVVGQAWITGVAGHVVVFSGGDDAEAFPAEIDTPIEPGDRIETGADGRAELALEADSIIELGSNSVFTVEPPQEESWDFTLGLGTLVAKIRRAFLGERTLRVVTPSAVAAVRGTEFGIEVGENGGTGVGVFDEGRVEVAHASDDSIEATTLRAREEVRVALDETLELDKEDGRRRLRRVKLKRIKRHNKRLKNLRKRRASLRKRWAKLAVARRHDRRAEMKKRFVEKLQAMEPDARRAAVRKMRRRALGKGLKERIERNKSRRQRRRIEKKIKKRGGHERFERKRRQRQQKRQQKRGRRRQRMRGQ